MQQALGLRESTIINTTDLTDMAVTGVPDKLLKETSDLRRKVVKAITSIDEYIASQNSTAVKPD